MTNQEYLTTQTTLINQWNLLQSLDLKAFLARIEEANALAPVIDPTLFREASGGIAIIKELANKAAAFKAVDCMPLITAALAHQAKGGPS